MNESNQGIDLIARVVLADVYALIGGWGEIRVNTLAS